MGNTPIRLSLYVRTLIAVVFVSVCLLPSAPAAAQDSPELVAALLDETEPELTLGELLLSEDFASDTAWETFTSDFAFVAVANEQLQIMVRDETTTWSIGTDTFANSITTVEATQLSEEDNNDYGVMCRANTDGGGEGYYFLISGDGFASIQLFDEGEGDYIVLQDWTITPAIEQGTNTNRISAVCHDTYLALFVNDELVLEAEDDTFAGGTVGLSATIYEPETTMKAAFDNLEVFATTGDAGGDLKDPQVAQTLTQHDAGWTEAVAELEQLGLIGSGGTLIFNEPLAFFDGTGSWFQALARNTSNRDVVMAATLDFTIGDPLEYEACGLLARIVTDGSDSIGTFLEVGFTNLGQVYWLDRRGDAGGDTDFLGLGLNLGMPHHILFIAQGDLLSVYIDGELVFEDVPIESRSGSFGIALVGAGETSRCEGTDVWAYSAPAFVEGLCEVFAANTVNQRSGPGTNNDVAGSLTAGSIVEVTGQASGGDGFTWYQLAGDVWVREDVVSVRGDCSDIPTVS